MNCKFCVFLLLVGVSLAVAGKFKQQNFSEIVEKCGTSKACHTAAKRCLGREVVGGVSHYEKLSVFNKCLDNNGQSGLRIDEANCVEKCPSGGAKTGESPHPNCQNEGTSGGARTGISHHFRCKKEIIDVLTSLEESVAGPVRCCYATSLKSDKVKFDGSINVVYFRNLIQHRIEEQTIKDILEDAVTFCLPKGASCNVYGFIDCVLNQCIDQVQTSGTLI